MADKQDTSPFADDESSTAQLLQGLISPAPAQSLVPPPPDTPPPTRPGESTPVTGSLATPPSQATPKVSPAPAYDTARADQLTQTRSSDAAPLDPNQPQYQASLGTKIRRGLAGYFSSGIGGAISANYNAPNARYSADDAARQGRLGQDDADLANLNKSYDERAKGYQQSIDQGRNTILLQRNNQLQQARQQAAGTQQQLADAKLGASTAQPAFPDRSADTNYVKVVSNGQVGYLPKANLAKAQQRDKNLKVLK